MSTPPDLYPTPLRTFNMLKTICFALVAGLSASSASAALTAAFIDVDNTSALTGFVTQDLMVTTTNDWGTAQILATLTTGSIYQDPNGSDFIPNPLSFPTFPALEFDSYLDGNGQQPSLAGQAVGLGGDVQEFSDSHIDITWFNTSLTDTGTFGIGRFTLSDDAIGSWSMLITSAGGFQAHYQGLINTGMFDLRDTGGGPPVIGDLDSDGFVGITDLNIILGAWNQPVFPGDPLAGDPSGDGFVGIEDLNTVLGNWNAGTPPLDGSEVPEPATLAAWLIVSPALLRRKR
jgi:hypothetical protein